MPEPERRDALALLRQQLREAGPHGVTPDLQATLGRLGCANEHEALLTALSLLLDKPEPASAVDRSSSEFVYSSLY